MMKGNFDSEALPAAAGDSSLPESAGTFGAAFSSSSSEQRQQQAAPSMWSSWESGWASLKQVVESTGDAIEKSGAGGVFMTGGDQSADQEEDIKPLDSSSGGKGDAAAERSDQTESLTEEEQLLRDFEHGLVSVFGSVGNVSSSVLKHSSSVLKHAGRIGSSVVDAFENVAEEVGSSAVESLKQAREALSLDEEYDDSDVDIPAIEDWNHEESEAPKPEEPQKPDTTFI